MIVDSSAVMAMVLKEPMGDQLMNAATGAASRRMSAGTWIELEAVNTRRFGNRLDKQITSLREYLSIDIAAVSERHADLARQAYRRYGMGSGHRARLNFGDCFAYALAVATDEPLLFVGDDFIHTDVRPALPL